jgi:acyl transferase domain-containing protein
MDRAEAKVMRSIFGEALPPELAVKDAIGEMAAAGGAQLVAAARALAAGNGSPRRALVNSFGAGGNFLAAVLEAAA